MRDVPEKAGAMSDQGAPREPAGWFSEGSKPPHPSLPAALWPRAAGPQPGAPRGRAFPTGRAFPRGWAGPRCAGQARRPWGSRVVLAPLGAEPSRSFLKAASASAASPPFPGLGPRAGAAGGSAPAPATHRPCATHPAPTLCCFHFCRVAGAAQGG